MGNVSRPEARSEDRVPHHVTADMANAFAGVALANISRAYPHKLDHLLVAAEPAAADHVAAHPVFYGSYDWHSSVHMHWLLVRLLRLQARIDAREEIIAALATRLTPARLAAEREYCARPAAATFERPYGWAWLLELRAELERLRPLLPQASDWAEAVDPLAADLAVRLAAFVDDAPYPIRSGTHANSAFAGILAGDFCITCRDTELERVIHRAAVRWHRDDRAAPLAYEPSLTDFLSPILAEAGLMRAVLPRGEFVPWCEAFFPRGLGPIAMPPQVVDRCDPQIAHLDGLCLSRGWLLRRLAASLPTDHPLAAEMAAAADRHLAVGLPRTVGGDYVGEHWLASFAALALGDVP